MPRFAQLACALLISSFSGLAAAERPLQVFILAGQSNMEGQGVVDLNHPQHYNGGKGTLDHVMRHSAESYRYAHIKNAAGNWTQRNDVMVRFHTERAGLRKGELTIGYTGYPGRHHIGPEFQFGHVVGEQLADPVLIIKTAWGGKSLHRDFRPPSLSEGPGEYYEKMLAEVTEGLGRIPEEFPALAGHKPRLAGFVWQQGWNDMVQAEARAAYAENLAAFIQDVRASLKSPTLPFIIGELGNMGSEASASIMELRAAQKAVAESPKLQAVKLVHTASFARPKSDSPNVGHGHHWFGNAESYFLIGDALARAVLELQPPSVERAVRKQPSGNFERRVLAPEQLSWTAAIDTSSAQAIDRALHWLVQHQAADGGWQWSHISDECDGKCTHPGTLGQSARNAATAMALLPLLGAGHTPESGEHQQSVARGVQYLLQNAGASGEWSESGGTMYSHGLASLALSEAYGMTKADQLKLPVSKAMSYIQRSQDPNGGGWRYAPRMPGDTSVTCWQVAAACAAQEGGLAPPKDVFRRAASFLDQVQVDDGVAYGYIHPRVSLGCTAAGLRTRILIQEHGINRAATQKGLKTLAAHGPSKSNFYYNYFATSALFHQQGTDWWNWQRTLNEELLDAQVQDGHARGSWQPASSLGADRGGRLYSTAMATLILLSPRRLGAPKFWQPAVN